MVEYTGFFYGTLMHPKILTRVIGNDGSHLRIAPAVLLEHTRHKVKFADFPGVVPISEGEELYDHVLEGDERSVRGAIVTGLTRSDILLLDRFEGLQYDRVNVPVHPLDSFQGLKETTMFPNDTIDEEFTPSDPPPLPKSFPPPFMAETYIFKDVSKLRPELWNFAEFVKQNAWKWHGKTNETRNGETTFGKAFFYGTLMHPKILKRVIGHEGSHLKMAPAVLLEHTRHQVKDADYPGVVPVTEAQKLYSRALQGDERCVRGAVVTGLTVADIRLLDTFEGSEYTREKVSVHPLDSLLSLDETTILPKEEVNKEFVPSVPPPLPDPLPPAMTVETYIYGDIKDLKVELWDFEDFVRQNAWKWYGKGADENPEFVRLDEQRGNPKPV